jgi:FtsZ-binding cell division protein ZapB
MQCEAREDYYRRMRANERRYKQVNEELADAKATITNLHSENAELHSENAELHSENAELRSANAEKDSSIAALQAEIERLKNTQKQLYQAAPVGQAEVNNAEKSANTFENTIQ